MTSSIAAIHVAKKQLGLDDETYRAKLQRIVGKTSTKDMSEAERQTVLTVFRNEGFAPRSAERRPNGKLKLDGQYAPKLQALWIAGWNLGIVRDRDDSALVSFIKRQTGIEHERWLRYADDARKVIEALKKWLEREGGVDWREIPGTAPPSRMHRPAGYRIAQAQWMKLYGNGQGFVPEALAIVNRDHQADVTREEWIVIMNRLGELVRAKAGAQDVH